MSSSQSAFAAQHAVPAGVTATRWWWVRHAPVREDNGCIYGQTDIGCDCSDAAVFGAVARILPHGAAWFASKLRRTHQTAEAIFAARPIAVGSYWFAPIDEPAPGGESFVDLYARTRAAIERINLSHAGQDVIAVAHGGTIKAAIGLALGGQPERGLAFTIDNCSVTRLDHLSSDGHAGWRIPMVNQQPWIAGAAHAAMHQPAGPEVIPTKLA